MTTVDNASKTSNMKQPEEKLQAECVRLFRYMYQPLQWRFFAIPNGGQRNAIVAAKLKKGGVVSGVWDLLLLVPRNGKSGLFIEMKAGKNKLTENQVIFQSENELDYAFSICYTVEQFLKSIRDYLG